jgi:hypothetical protein
VLKVVGRREGWELHIVAGGMMDIMPTITPPITIYSSHTSPPPTTLNTYLSRIMFGSLIIAF